MIRVLAIDPGYDRVGFAVMESGADGKEQLIFSECFTTDRDQEINERIFTVGDRLDALIREYAPTFLALENVFSEKNVKTVISVAEAKGVMKYVARTHKLPIFEFSPPQIKIAVTGYGKATKVQVADMVPKLIGVDASDMIDDEVDAIAVGITALAHHRS